MAEALSRDSVMKHSWFLSAVNCVRLRIVLKAAGVCVCVCALVHRVCAWSVSPGDGLLAGAAPLNTHHLPYFLPNTRLLPVNGILAHESCTVPQSAYHPLDRWARLQEVSH